MRKVLCRLARRSAGGTLLILTLLTLTLNNAFPASTSPIYARWYPIATPLNGEAGGWVLAGGTDVRLFTTASDGTFYAATAGTAGTLFTSKDRGRHWYPAGNVTDQIVAIAAPPESPGAVYYATTTAVHFSKDGGRTFRLMSTMPVSGGNIEITSLDVTGLDRDIIAIGTRDKDAGEFGGVYLFDTKNPVWTDTGLTGYDVYAVAFSPGYARDWQLVAVITNETDTYTTSKIGNGGWGEITGITRLLRDIPGGQSSVVLGQGASIAFPAGYDPVTFSAASTHYIGLNSGYGAGDVFQINLIGPGLATARDLNIGRSHGTDDTDVSDIAAAGSFPQVFLVAGAAGTTTVYTSADRGGNWSKSYKDPTGSFTTGVLLPPDYTTTAEMFAATSGEQSAISISRDGGITWNQISFIDDSIQAITDLAPSPDYDRDGTIFMLTFGSGHSLWRSRDGGSNWERTLTSSPALADTLDRVGLPPNYGKNCLSVFVAATSNSRAALLESTDYGQSYHRRFTLDPATGQGFPIDAWAIAGPKTIFIASYDGSQARIYRTSNSGFSYSVGTPAGNYPVCSLALSPVYDQDRTLLAGNTAGQIFLSGDDGISFQTLPSGIAPPTSGVITVAFDPLFAENRTVYAASDRNVFRFIVHGSDGWKDIGGSLPAWASLSSLGTGQSGTLYVTIASNSGGLGRCLYPASSSPVFENTTSGLEDDATLTGLWLSGHRLWSIDTTNIKLMTLNDTLTVPVTPVSPENGISGIGNLASHSVRGISLYWETLDGATGYQWQCSPTPEFSPATEVMEGSTTASSARLLSLEPATIYYWRVRASAPFSSPWSEKLSFITCADMEPVPLRPESPPPGAANVTITPSFQWTAIAGAQAYELEVATDPDFQHPVITRADETALPVNTWQSDTLLENGRTYYWRVRALSAGTKSPWSAAGIFTTEPAANATAEAVKEPTAVSPPSPENATATVLPAVTMTPLPTSPAQQVVILPSPQTQTMSPPLPASPDPDIPHWITYLIGGLLLVNILALSIVLVIVLKIHRVT